MLRRVDRMCKLQIKINRGKLKRYLNKRLGGLPRIGNFSHTNDFLLHYITNRSIFFYVSNLNTKKFFN